MLGTDHRHVGPVEEFLEHHRVTGSSPHTVRAYAKALQLWWRYLELDGRDWTQADVPALAGFVTWLREGTPPGVALLDPAAAARAAAGGGDAGHTAGSGGQFLPLPP